MHDGIVLQASDITKSFGATKALRGVSLTLRAGEVHGLMGENGAGKSTLIKIVTGLYTPDAGRIELLGSRIDLPDPREAARLGICAVYQEINLIPERSVAENIFLGRAPRRGPLIDRRRMEEETISVLQRYGIAADPRARIASLSLGVQQMVSIARVVSQGARVVVLDEPTSALSGAEVAVLFEVVDRLRADGIALLFVSHRLSEVYRLCDRLTVLRDGRHVVSAPIADLPRGALVTAMLGWETEATAPPRPPPRATTARGASEKSGLSLRGLSWRHRVREVGLDIAPGETVGLAGLLGSGRTETMKAAFGAERRDGGEVAVAGRALPAGSPAASLHRGLAFLSEDRRSEGIFPRLSVQENLTAAVLPRISRFGIISRRREAALMARFRAALSIRMADPKQPISGLSGGNQQKVLLGRCMASDPAVLLLDDPTRGIDVGAKAEVHRVVHDLAAQGLAVLVTSSETDELLEMAGRLAVLDEGRITRQCDAAGLGADDVLALLAAQPEQVG